MTLKRRKLLKHLETSSTMKEAAIKAGYSHKTDECYKKDMKRYIAKIIHSDPEAIKARFNNIADKASAKEDFTAELRAIEGLARINAMFTDKSEVKTTPVNEIRITHIDTKVNRISDKIEEKQDIPIS